jgi:hypothetical protein
MFEKTFNQEYNNALDVGQLKNLVKSNTHLAINTAHRVASDLVTKATGNSLVAALSAEAAAKASSAQSAIQKSPVVSNAASPVPPTHLKQNLSSELKLASVTPATILATQPVPPRTRSLEQAQALEKAQASASAPTTSDILKKARADLRATGFNPTTQNRPTKPVAPVVQTSNSPFVVKLRSANNRGPKLSQKINSMNLNLRAILNKRRGLTNKGHFTNAIKQLEDKPKQKSAGTITSASENANA